MSYEINKIKMIISDVDGVWTDGAIYKGKDGIELKRFDVTDGAGVAILRAAGLKLALISGRKSDATAERAAELKIDDVYNGTLNKIPPYESLKEKYNFSDNEIAYIGDDMIDIPVMELVGVPIATENASKSCKATAVHVTEKSGGYGAFREAVEWILSEQGRLEDVIADLRKMVQNQK
ncbi:MAG: HAD hydrolase family protein [Candidatus Marinimicrobia bacterium]|jgi:3-deoxy-D-manno-octulosonate 8-phosphate phosphatase (KDO 8-P phosphatase)|nr:HAD hydrolase family protein [Candidatus Neomarinimicrobiota bacterium]MBT3676855.1 HAD hydrolase family protein [Candidatus Neomarinimicrobiota bacterium]MBT3763430.1 HAD hydrolase family protein [Candidatus Neomarinimicrobiota bacterium]MBT4068110.1 HAD hydrolase family protein [Candidatus Neomarinimicrobiota bacterium]MBT4271204.1 HAD hydrolase family protein [Candidatus Neomarinimicrobiota bacterium]